MGDLFILQSNYKNILFIFITVAIYKSIIIGFYTLFQTGPYNFGSYAMESIGITTIFAIIYFIAIKIKK